VGYRGAEFEGTVVAYYTKDEVFAYWTLCLDDGALVDVQEPLGVGGDPLLNLMGHRVKASLHFKQIRGEIVDFFRLTPVNPSP
jgi:hypothetical protein